MKVFMLALMACLPFVGQDAKPPRSYFARPLHLAEARPEIRSLRVATASYVGAFEARSSVVRLREAARDQAEAWREELVAGESIAALVTDASNHELGSYVEGVLDPSIDAFLFDADVGELSPVIETRTGFHVFERVATHVGCRHLLVSSERGESAAKELLARALAGADFADLAREHSDDAFTKEAGGALAIFERGTRDALLKAAAFGAELNEVVGPIRSSRGWHLVQRVRPEELDPQLAEPSQARASLLLVTHRDMPSEKPISERSSDEAKSLALDFHARLTDGASFAELAGQLNDDVDGVRRLGDLGWLHRSNPMLEGFLDRVFTVEPGHLFEPLPVRAGWVLLVRTR